MWYVSIGRYGNWGICHTYAAFFVLAGLAAVGKTYSNSEVVRKACDFLLSKQQKSGGWGESYLSCKNLVRKFTHFYISLKNIILFLFTCLIIQEYIQLEGNQSNLVQTAWAMMGLIHAGQVGFRISNFCKSFNLNINLYICLLI